MSSKQGFKIKDFQVGISDVWGFKAIEELPGVLSK